MRIDLHDLLWNVFNAAGLGQVDIPLGIRHDHVLLHHGTGAHAIRIKAVALVADDPVAGSREAAADRQALGLDEHHAIARVAADLVALNSRACHDAGDVEAIPAICPMVFPAVADPIRLFRPAITTTPAPALFWISFPITALPLDDWMVTPGPPL